MDRPRLARAFREFRRSLGLTANVDPVFRDKYSHLLHLAMFSKALARPQPDWFSPTLQRALLSMTRARLTNCLTASTNFYGRRSADRVHAWVSRIARRGRLL